VGTRQGHTRRKPASQSYEANVSAKAALARLVEPPK